VKALEVEVAAQRVREDEDIARERDALLHRALQRELVCSVEERERCAALEKQVKELNSLKSLKSFKSLKNQFPNKLNT
jgi:hypothetical protein